MDWSSGTLSLLRGSGFMFQAQINLAKLLASTTDIGADTLFIDSQQLRDFSLRKPTFQLQQETDAILRRQFGQRHPHRLALADLLFRVHQAQMRARSGRFGRAPGQPANQPGAPQMQPRHIRSDPIKPGRKTPAVLQGRQRTPGSNKCLLRQIASDLRIAHYALKITKNTSVEVFKERGKRSALSLPGPL